MIDLSMLQNNQPYPVYYRQQPRNIHPPSIVRLSGSMLSGSLLNTSLIKIQNMLFHKVEVIRQGQTSCVLHVVNEKGEHFALKVVDFGGNGGASSLASSSPLPPSDVYQMFMKELQFMSRLSAQSPRIAKVIAYDINRSALVGKMLMELGSDDFRSVLPLRAHPSVKIISEPRRKMFWKQMVQAIAVVHANLIAHSDVKPENFIIVNANLKLIDFGMSFHIPPGQSVAARPVAGTPDYMPPEVCKCTRTHAYFGYKADIWSLGCILYEMTFGYRPFEHITNNADKIRTIASMRNNVPIPPICHPNLHHILNTCLQLKPSNRPSIEQILRHPYLL